MREWQQLLPDSLSIGEPEHHRAKLVAAIDVQEANRFDVLAYFKPAVQAPAPHPVRWREREIEFGKFTYVGARRDHRIAAILRIRAGRKGPLPPVLRDGRMIKPKTDLDMRIAPSHFGDGTRDVVGIACVGCCPTVMSKGQSGGLRRNDERR